MPGGKKKQQEVESEESMSDFDEEHDEDEMEEEEFDIIEAMNEMTLAERRKVYALKGFQEEYNELMIQYRLELATLELKQHKSRAADFARRARIISGEEEVKAEEVAQGKKDVSSGKIEEIPDSDEEEEKKPKRKGVTVVAPKDTEKSENGIPEFWLHALKHNDTIVSQITEKDSEILAFVTDISTEYIEDKPELGFVLTFTFAENPFFSQKKLTKTCHWNQERKGDEEQIDSLEGTKIDWSAPEKNPTVVIKEKKQRHKSGKGVRIVKKEEKTESFFHFFSPVQLDDEGAPVGDFSEEEEETLEERISQDEDLTLCIQSTIVPRACYYYTGEPLAKHAEALRAA
eukprot:152107_1